MTCYILLCFLCLHSLPVPWVEYTLLLQQKSNSHQHKNQTTTEPSWTSASHNPHFVHLYVIQAVGTEDQNVVEPIRIISWNLGSEKVCLFNWTLKPQLFPSVLGSHWEHYCHTLSSHSARTSPWLKDFWLPSQTHSLFIFFENSLFIKLQTSSSQNTRLWQLEDLIKLVLLLNWAQAWKPTSYDAVFENADRFSFKFIL